MDYYLLTDMTAQIGYELAAAGAETFRIEETVRRVLAAYGIECEAFAIPNCVMVSLEADNGKPLMVMKRVGFHGNEGDDAPRLRHRLRGLFPNCVILEADNGKLSLMDDEAAAPIWTAITATILSWPSAVERARCARARRRIAANLRHSQLRHGQP